ncbi:SpoIIE family protein phosphatase [Streptomyces sp. SID8111]|uniref:SpoIIE family protein phosphatase n=1 Tax=Streptomyces sp. SID8111 TaxID=2706100 RepID=UPI0013C02825|nr:SpoIIE family protein phosphatase [Streptomyces sp. SID8111]NEC29135.1 SpoIIE family protein phosphatase [Streptomyces sp. SID8111]
MPSPLSADRPAAQPPGRGPVDTLISRARRLKGDVDAVRRGTPADGTDPEDRWERALYDLAVHQLDDVGRHLSQLRDGPPLAADDPAPLAPPAPRRGSLLSRVGSAEWNLLTDEATWSAELYRILGRDPSSVPLTLDELPSLVHDEDRPTLTGMVTDCLIDARPIDGEFRVVHPDGAVRTVHMMGEPVLGSDGSTASMWAVLRDVSELRRCRRAVSESRASLRPAPPAAEDRVATELREAVRPVWRGSLRIPRTGPGGLEVAALSLPASAAPRVGGDWYDALELPDGTAQLGAGDLTGHGVGVSSALAMLLGAARALGTAGTSPGPLMACLNRLTDGTVQPVLGSAVCLRYRPDTRTLVWAQAGHPAPLLFRDGTGRILDTPDGVLLGASSGARYGEATETLEPGDLLLVHTDGLVPGHARAAGAHRLLALAPRLTRSTTAQDCVRTVAHEIADERREDDGCLLVARVTG